MIVVAAAAVRGCHGILMSMRHRASGGRGGLSPYLKEFARRIEEADGIVPLQPGEHRPLGYYLSGI